VFTKLIDRNTTIPTKKTQVFSTASDMQTAVDIHILQGERPMAKDNVELGKFTLVGIPPAPRGVPQVEVTFDIDANGILHVGAKDTATGKEQTMRVTAPLKMPDEEIKKKMEEAEKFSEKDKQEFELAQANNEAESLIYITEKTINELKDKLSKDQFDRISEVKKKLQDAVSSKDVGKIRTETENLKKVLQEIGASAYQQAGPGTGAPPPPGGEKGYEHVKKKKKGDNVVEGEYEKVDDEKK
jgi:molecular chaperone DnaK